MMTSSEDTEEVYFIFLYLFFFTNFWLFLAQRIQILRQCLKM